MPAPQLTELASPALAPIRHLLELALTQFVAHLPLLVRTTTWLLDWLATYLLHSTVLIGLAWLISRSTLGGRFNLTNAVGLWRAALVGGVITSLMVASGALGTGAPTVRVAEAWAPRIGYRLFVSATSDGPRLPSLSTQISVRPLWPFALVVAWLAIVALGGVFLFVAYRRFRSTAARSAEAGSTFLDGALAQLHARSGLRHPVVVTVGDRYASPFAIGSREICVPRRALYELSHLELESMLAHELAHVKRRDGAWLLVARAIEVAFVFQPLNRLARRRMVEASEFAADEWAVSVTGRPVTLATCLARVAEWSLEDMQFAPAMATRRSSALVRRVRRLTTGSAERGPSPIIVTALACALIGAGAFIPRVAIGGGGMERVGAERTILVRRGSHGGDMFMRRFDAEIQTRRFPPGTFGPRGVARDRVFTPRS